MTYEVFRKVRIPVIAMGGITDARDALEFIICGASVVCAGTVNFIDPGACGKIKKGIEEYLKANKMRDLAELRGSLRI